MFHIFTFIDLRYIAKPLSRQEREQNKQGFDLQNYVLSPRHLDSFQSLP